MPHEIAELLEMVIGVVAGLGFTGIVSWTIVRVRQPRSSVSSREVAALDERLARLEQAVDAIAVEVERSGEAQRFAARLLSERLAETPPSLASARPAARAATPDRG